MIVPDDFLEWLEKNPAHKKAFNSFPLAYFGRIIPYPKQAALIKEWIKKQPKVWIITGWKRCSKSAIGSFIGSCWLMGYLNRDWPGAVEMGIDNSLQWTKRYNKERVGLIGGKTLDHIESVLLAQYRAFLPPSFIKSWFSKGKPRIELVDAQKMIVRSYDQDLESWKSGQYQMIHLDEEPPLNVFLECLERTRTTKGKIIITVAVDDADVSWIPECIQNPMKVIGTDSFLWSKIGVEDVPNSLYPLDEKKNVFRQYDGTVFEKAVRFGDLISVAGRWIPEFQKEIHCIPSFPIPDSWKRFRAIDPGTAAPTACLWCAVHPSTKMFFIYREYYKAGTTIGERCSDIIEASGNRKQRDGDMWMEIQNKESYEMTLMDHAEFHKDAHTGDGLDYAYVQAGLNVQPCTTLGQEARRDILRKFMFVDKTKKHFISHEEGGPMIYIFEDQCPNLVWEIQKKSFKKTNNERAGTIERKISNKDDHAIDCLESLACEMQWMVGDFEIP